MVLNTLTVGAAVTPAVIQTYISHYTNRKPLRQKPTAHISYHEGLRLIRQFLNYASHHTVEELQAFTAQWVPHPRWVKVDRVTIAPEYIAQAADAIIGQLGDDGVKRVGGKQWWQWRRNNAELQAEWIEMRKDYQARKRDQADGRRVMLYVHGGAYFFGSTDEHRYQLQRHARKLRARVLAPRYRLAPQFPFPCGLQDCLAAYLYLLTVQEPADIIVAGDSAGGGMVMSMLVILRDQGLPLPAGTILISPWVDLTHSFPSLAGSGELDYIPAHGFMQKPSAAWPPPNDDEMEEVRKAVQSHNGSLPRGEQAQTDDQQEEEEAAIQGFKVERPSRYDGDSSETARDENDYPANRMPGPGRHLSIMIDGVLVELKDQIQMYTTNQLISHPLVSTILQPSLGGLPPMLILTGGGELLRDEQIYLAHKAANPAKYPPGEAYLDEFDPERKILHKYKPTDVQLQVWDDLCHVAPTLSFTRPAKFMYRSIAQFGAWALARAQKTSIEILDDDEISIISSGSDTESSSEEASDVKEPAPIRHVISAESQIGKAGDPLPKFQNHMIRQRVDRHGVIHPLAAASSLPALKMPAAEIGVIKKGPVEKWMQAKRHWDGRYASQKRRVQKRRLRDMLAGYEGFGNSDKPPPSALAGRRKRGDIEMKEKKQKKSYGLMLWTLWGSSHDEEALRREEKMDAQADSAADTTTTTGLEHGTETTTTSRPRALSGAARLTPREISVDQGSSRARSRRRAVTDAGQADAGELSKLHSGVGMPIPTVGGVDFPEEEKTSDSPSSASNGNHDSPANGQPVNKFLSILQPTLIANPETASILTTSTAGYAASEAASTTAVFAAPGVIPRPNGGSVSGGTIGSDDINIFVTPEDGEADEAETSRRGSLLSVERLRAHQVSPLEDGETMSVTSAGTADTGLRVKKLGMDHRNLSAVAIKGVEGVIKPIDSQEAGDERPKMPDRDEFTTAQES